MATSIQPMRYSEAERRRGLRVLLVSTFFAWGGFFMVVPMISVHYVDGLGWTAASIGLILAIRQFAQQGLTVMAGVLADRFGVKTPILVGMALRVLGFGSMAFAGTFGLLLASSLLSALGGALFESPRAAATAALTHEAERPRFYTLVGVAGGLGTTLGTQLGVLLLRADFALVSVAAAISYLVIFVLIWVFLPPVRVAADEAGLFSGIGLALRDQTFTRYTAFMAGHWFMMTQFLVALPLVTVVVMGSTEGIAWVYGVNAVVSVLLAYPLPRLFSRYVSPAVALIIGNLLTALGLFGIGLSLLGGTPVLLAAVFVYSIGIVIVRPNDQTVLAGLANPVALGSYFGVALLSLGIGGGLGSVAGGWLYDLGVSLRQPLLLWLVCTVVGVASSAGLWWTMVATSGRRLRAPEIGGV
ncbi:MAG: MFS transporter [Chloroflexota bacterium]|nr:MFS transporter [Chloroflexota bacterium]